MTIKEKREKIKEYCNQTSAVCSECELYSVERCWTGASDDEIEENYNILFGPPQLLTHPELDDSDLDQEGNYTLTLTKSQVSNLLEFFDLNFIESIRSYTGIDNMECAVNMCEIYKSLKKLSGT